MAELANLLREEQGEDEEPEFKPAGRTIRPRPHTTAAASSLVAWVGRNGLSRSLALVGAALLLVIGLSVQWHRLSLGSVPFSAVSGDGLLHHTTDDGMTAPCRWKFDHYQPSPYEAEWVANVRIWKDGVCQKLASPRHAEASERIVRRTSELFARKLQKNALVIESNPSPADDLLSRMHYSRECWNPKTAEWFPTSGNGMELIEPLWGMLRDPFDRWCPEGVRLYMDGWPREAAQSNGQSKAHILPTLYAPWVVSLDSERLLDNTWNVGRPPWLSSWTPVVDSNLGSIFQPAENVFLDLGSSYFSRWGTEEGAASGKWIYDVYTARGGLSFKKFVAVEIESLSPTEAYSQLPPDLVGAYTLMNVPLTMDAGDKLNVMRLLRSMARPGDFTVLKLDIDSAPIELPIAHALRDDKELAGLVSELFFEHHVDIAPMRWVWGFDLKEDLVDSYKLFTALRSNGIRAHSWP